MNHPIADARKLEPTGLAVPGSSLTLRIRFVAGMAIVLGGAGVLLSDLLHLMPPLG